MGPSELAVGLSVFLVATATGHAQTTSTQTHPQTDTAASSIQRLALSTQDAQAPSPLPSQPIAVPLLVPAALWDDQQLIVLRQWTHDYQDWKAWYLQWRNQPEPGWFSSRPRRQPPMPPAWLPSECDQSVDDHGPLADACAALREWQANDMTAAVMTQQLAQARSTTEAPAKTRFWEHIHVDAFWPMTRVGSSAFGLVGVHTTVHVTGRFQVFLTPGFILMRAPTLSGDSTWSAATDWGFSFRLFDLRVPLADRPGSVHVNVARVWLFGTSGIASTGETYLAGFSLTFKQR